ncbi:esterase [Paenarthrobacter sp. Z7-10]|uniref:alpha/beta hydrolase n=1 Tax=Paenarthrobacter sp. Z7-10 TaxID=2787635 RepID=UPI0022A9459A|nr:alpha/beta hydrolase-fold protein [Paenarthrobacter sp. Z7-10]MCZ2403973.1 esterase [Paenarthrobacter sp. Z7-10]
MGRISGIHLMTGVFPAIIAILACGAAAVLLLRRGRRWLLFVAGGAALATVLTGAIDWYIVHVLGLTAYDLPLEVSLWIGVGVMAVLLMVLNLVFGKRLRRLLAPVAMTVVLLSSAMQINTYFDAYRTIGDVTGASTASITPFRAKPLQSIGSSNAPTGPVISHWVEPAGLPAHGTVNSVQIPGNVSGFTARTGYVYLPPAYQAPRHPLLPVLVLITGQPGAPAGWLKSGRLQFLMDSFAAAHKGLAPVVVVPDVNGSNLGNTMCLDSNIALADTYLSVDIPRWIKDSLGIDPNPKHWVIGGFSFGGTCALQMAALHPKIYPSAIDLSGELEPSLAADRSATIAAAFGGNSAAFDAVTPLNVMARTRYPDSWIYFAAGAQDGQFSEYMNQVATAAKASGMTVATDSVPGAGHAWTVPIQALGPALTWLAPRLGLAR